MKNPFRTLKRPTRVQSGAETLLLALGAVTFVLAAGGILLVALV